MTRAGGCGELNRAQQRSGWLRRAGSETSYSNLPDFRENRKHSKLLPCVCSTIAWGGGIVMQKNQSTDLKLLFKKKKQQTKNTKIKSQMLSLKVCGLAYWHPLETIGFRNPIQPTRVMGPESCKGYFKYK